MALIAIANMKQIDDCMIEDMDMRIWFGTVSMIRGARSKMKLSPPKVKHSNSNPILLSVVKRK